MKTARFRLLVATVAASAAFSANARSSGDSADELLSNANGILQQIDAGQFAEVWANAAPLAKARIMHDQFISDMRRSRQMVGQVRDREWASVTRIRYHDVPGLPDGLYANVDVATTLTTGASVHEKLSFRFEDDGRWYLTGYVPGQVTDAQPVAGGAQTPSPNTSMQVAGGVDGRGVGQLRASSIAPRSRGEHAVPPNRRARVDPQGARPHAAPVDRTTHRSHAVQTVSKVSHNHSQSMRQQASSKGIEKSKHRNLPKQR